LDEFIAPRRGPRGVLLGVQVISIAPSGDLAPFVERFTVVESSDEVTRVLLPERGLVLGVRYRGAASVVDDGRATRVADAAVTGVLAAARRMRTHAGSGIVLAQFRAAGAARFFAPPLHELFGRTVPLEDLIPRAEVQRLSERVAGQPDIRQRVAVLEQFLLGRMTGPAPDPIAMAAVAAIDAARGSLRIAALARSLAISQDPLEKKFRRAVGASPKHVALLTRLRHAIRLGRRGDNWSRVAFEAGYFDQSHLIRDFRAVTGDPPARFFRSAEYC
jgi:AraC-like DNA-binding protein